MKVGDKVRIKHSHDPKQFDQAEGFANIWISHMYAYMGDEGIVCSIDNAGVRLTDIPYSYPPQMLELSPKFVHDCDNCVFIKHFEEYDIYICKHIVIARYSDDPAYNMSWRILDLKQLGEDHVLVRAFKFGATP